MIPIRRFSILWGMKYILLLAGVFFIVQLQAQPIAFEKIDTTMKIGKYGYKVNCRNKEIKSNILSVRPLGYESPANENMNMPMRGRISATMVDDLNGDGLADLVIFIYTDSAAIHGTVYALISDGEKSLMPVGLPDPALDGKINTGYKGHDVFTMLEGTVLERYPIFKTGDKDDAPTGGTRTIQYGISKGESGGYKFTILRFYDTH
jgi:hypothetical protein